MEIISTIKAFYFFIDYQSLKCRISQVIHTPKQEHYLSKLLGFLYTIKYRPSENNRAANALSRRDLDDGSPKLKKYR